MSLRAVCYARVSSLAQREAQTIDSQLRALPAFVASQGWTLARPASTYVDDGRSAKSGQLDKREAFQRLLTDAATGAFDVVVVIDLDRLTRAEDMTERGAILGAFQRAGVRIAIASTGQLLDLSSSLGDLFATLQGFFAAEENRKRRERTVRGKLTAISRGWKPSGPTPYGWRYDRSTHTWSIDEDEGAVVREIFARVARGETLSAVAAVFAARSVERPRGGAWTTARTHQITKNPAYRGEYVADKAKQLIIKVPPIVDEAMWHAAQRALDGRRDNRSPFRRYTNLCQGISRCEVCGSRILLTGNSSRRYYVCESKKQLGRGIERCLNPMRQVEETDIRVWAAVRNVLEDPELLLEAAQGRRGVASDHDWEGELRDYEKRLARLERTEGVVLERFRRGMVSQGALDRELAAAARERTMLERNRDVARAQLAGVARHRAEVDELEETLETLRERLDELDAVERRTLVRLIVPGRDGYQITIGPAEVVVVGHVQPHSPGVCDSSAAASTRERVEDAKPLRFRLVV